MSEKIKQIIESSISVKRHVLQDEELLNSILKIADKIATALKEGKRVYFCGNGGRAGNSQHLAAELRGRFYRDRAALPAEALHCNSSYLTAVANDYGYDVIYA